MQCAAVDFLNLTFSRGSDAIAPDQVKQVYDSVLNQLLFCVRTHKLDVQAKLLSLLHVVAPQFVNFLNVPLIGSATTLFTILEDALRTKKNRAALPYYVDFIVSIVACINKPSQNEAVIHLVKSMCHEVKELVISFEKLDKPVYAAFDEEVTLLFSSLEKLISHLANDISYDADERRKTMESASYGLRGLTDLVTGVFVSDSSALAITPEIIARETLLVMCQDLVGNIIPLWARFERPKSDKVELGPVPSIEDLPHNAIDLVPVDVRVRYRIRKLLETIQRCYPVESMEMFADLWNKTRKRYKDEKVGYNHR